MASAQSGGVRERSKGSGRPKQDKGARLVRRASGPEEPPLRDRHRLYQLSVQCPEADVKFFTRIFRTLRGRIPLSLKEDFCGTAHLSGEWVRSLPERTAVGVDLDQPTLDWGRRYNLAKLGAAADRVTLIKDDVRHVREPRVDLVAAMNFSYFVFKQREELRGYFSSVKDSLKRDGVCIVDIFGGWEAQQLTTETKKLDGFRYQWQQAHFDPITHDTTFFIHFRFPDGSMIKRAFRYDWRFWTVPEVRELLAEAGFAHTEVYWEGTERDTGEGNGGFKPARQAKSCAGWIAYILAWS
ncbi:MAG: class I SAM-dependent methyltransferase [Candidatus Eisenbacteria bacterium]|nr:class I SAM-dependent methyltransferase [Candidatus Eisenbacteria bacterium]